MDTSPSWSACGRDDVGVASAGIPVDWSALTPREIVFWSGAGISHDAPTRGPLGRALTDRALDHYTEPGVGRRIAGLYDELEVPNAQYRPRLETVLDAVFDAYGVEGLADVLSDLAVAVPNAHHHWFATHVLAGGRHITANFDTCIERAMGMFTSADRSRVVHFHGALDPDSSVDALGARLGAIENGFPAEVVARLDDVIASDQTSVLVFVGYSGSDFFDATPYLLQRVADLRDKTIVWHNYANEPITWSVDPASVSSDLLARLAKAGLTIHVARGRLDALTEQISPAWRQHNSEAAPTNPTPDWTPRLGRPIELRRAATVALYARLGFRTGVISAFEAAPPTTHRDWDRLADAYWGAGRYAEALDAWTEAFADDNDIDRARLAERQGAILWITGRLRAAEHHLWQAVNQWCRPEPAAGAEACALLLETYARVIEHMRRTPDARLLIRKARVKQVERLLRGFADELRGREGIALEARLGNVLRALERQPDPELENHIANFAESEALHAWLNYEHARLRSRATYPSPGQPPPQRHDFAQLAARQTALGATADAARVYLLPGAASHFAPVDAFRAFAPIEMARWHRIRLLAGYSLRWIRAKLRRNSK